jgi:hypothetical protein
LIALLICLAVGGGLVLLGFAIGIAFEQMKPSANVIYLSRHPAHHHRPARRAVHAPRHLTLVPPPFDFEASDDLA